MFLYLAHKFVPVGSHKRQRQDSVYGRQGLRFSTSGMLARSSCCHVTLTIVLPEWGAGGGEKHIGVSRAGSYLVLRSRFITPQAKNAWGLIPGQIM